MPTEEVTLNVPNVKTGFEVAILEGTTRAVVFTTAFLAAPDVVIAFGDDTAQQATCSAHTVTVAGFTIRVDQIGGGGAVTRDVAWIASDVGDT